ncbi:hypothetical protein AHAS_Ahas03G0097500 [Arachis hypogaea]
MFLAAFLALHSQFLTRTSSVSALTPSLSAQPYASLADPVAEARWCSGRGSIALLPCSAPPLRRSDSVVTCEPVFVQIIEQFQKCHVEHPVGKFFGECTDLKIKLDRCFRQEKALKRKANFEESKKFKEQLRAFRKENAASGSQ